MKNNQLKSQVATAVRACQAKKAENISVLQLDAQAREFFNEARNVELLRERQTVRFSEILRFYSEDFLKQAPSLIAYANGYRSEKIPEAWRVEYIPYDWTLNRQ